MYHLQFSLQAASPETFGYTLVYSLKRKDDSVGNTVLEAEQVSTAKGILCTMDWIDWRQ
jgi:hypothetical protein